MTRRDAKTSGVAALPRTALRPIEHVALDRPNMKPEHDGPTDDTARVGSSKRRHRASRAPIGRSAAVSSNPKQALPPQAAPHISAEEQVHQQGIQPIVSVDELAFPGVWESDEELNEFLADLYSSRHANTP